MTEERLRQAAQEAGRIIADSFPAPETFRHEFSPAFEKKMRSLLRRAKHQGLYKALRRVACVLLVLLLSCGAWFSVDAQAREAFLGWVNHLVEGAQHYFFSGEPAKEETPGQYTLSEIPEGYEPYETYRSDHEAVFVYMDKEGKALRFEYLKKDTETTFAETYFLTGDMEKQVVSVSGTTAELYIDKTGEIDNLIVWQDEATETLLSISAYLDGDTLIRLAESVQYQP